MTDILLEARNVYVSYGKKDVLKGCDLVLEAGKVTGILGLNGSGKTTFLRAVGGLISCKKSIWRFSGNDIEQMSMKERGKHISYIPQKSNFIYQISTIDVVLMGCYPRLSFLQVPGKEEKRKAAEILEKLGLEKQADQDYLSLSEGQKQLVILARNMLQDAPVMLMDEPDSALDFVNHHKILAHIKKTVIEKCYSVFISLHDPNYALEYCDRILILSEGRIKAQIFPRESSIEEIREKLSILYSDTDVICYCDRPVMVKKSPLNTLR